MKIRVEYFGDTVDEYPVDPNDKQWLLAHFLTNPNVRSVTFIRGSAPSANEVEK